MKNKIMNFFKWVAELMKSESGKTPGSTPAPVEPAPPIDNTPIYPPTKIRFKDMRNDGSPVTPDWQFLWDNCVVDEKAKAKLDVAVNIFVLNRSKYQEVHKATNIKDWFIAGLHMRESDFDFNGCLHNGDPWNKVTRHVPKGRGPWSSWSESAIDALNFDNITASKVDSIAKALEYAFRFNGIGYKTKIGDSGLVEYSPYVCAFTNWHDETSKYTSDGKYDPTAKEAQLGVMAFWKELENRGLINVEE